MPEIAAALRAVLPPGVVLGLPDETALWDGEALPGAVPQRLAEFARGRSACRDAMRGLRHPAAAIPVGADRAPVWPAGLTGSISHCAGACLAVLGPRAEWAGLGLDIEPARPLPADLWPFILLPEERAALPVQTPGLAALAIFAAKEAAYKAQYAMSRTLFDFQALSVTLAPGRFTACFVAAVAPFGAGHPLHGVRVQAGGFVAAFCGITA